MPEMDINFMSHCSVSTVMELIITTFTLDGTTIVLIVVADVNSSGNAANLLGYVNTELIDASVEMGSPM